MARSDASFIYYYQTELAYYRELAQEFGAAHPEVAHLVAERGGDGAADRMFQGAALLTARLRQRVEDDFPEIIHPLFDQLWPQFLRPVPAVTLLRFTPLPNALRQSQPIPAGTEVRSAPVAGTQVQCPFRTCSRLWLHPLELSEATLERPVASDLQVRLRFKVTGGARLGGLSLPPLRLQLLGEPRTKLTLYAWLAHEARGVSLRSPAGQTLLRLPRGAIRAVGFEPEEALCPVQPTPRGGLHLLQEYFVFLDKFLAVEVSGLDRLPEETELQELDLVFHLGPLEEGGLRVDDSCFSLGCVPAINLSDSQRVDVRVSADRRRYRLELPHQGEVFEVEQVRAYDARRGDWVEYPRVHDAQVIDPDLPCHLVTRAADVVEGVETYVEVVDTEGEPVAAPAEMLQVVYTETSGPLATRLGAGEVDRPSPSSPEFATFTNLTPVNVGLPVGLARERFWRLLAKLNMHSSELFRHEGLELLIDEAEGGRSGVGPDILQMRVETSSRLVQQMVAPMRQVELELADTSFSCPGQMFLFASVLSRVLARPPGSTVFNQLTVVGRPSGLVYRFPPT